VKFLVQFPRPRMPDLYRLADIFVLGSLFEMMPLAVLEATASELPCLVNRHPVLEWMTGPAGLPVDMATPGELARSVAALCDDVNTRLALGRAGRAHCQQNFGRNAVVARYLEYYQFVAQQRKTPHTWKGRLAPTATIGSR